MSHTDSADSPTVERRIPLNRQHARGRTTTPPLSPPMLLCPQCERQLRYRYSYIGGVSAHRAEQWDYLDCPSGCGQFQYRHRSKKLRPV
jgi:hypothetical protein